MRGARAVSPDRTPGPANLLDSGPLYAGANVTKIAGVKPAAELVAALIP